MFFVCEKNNALVCAVPTLLLAMAFGHGHGLVYIYVFCFFVFLLSFMYNPINIKYNPIYPIYPNSVRQGLCFRQIWVNDFWVNELGYMGCMGLYGIFI